MRILKYESAQITVRFVSVAYTLWLPIFLNTVLNIKKVRGAIEDQSMDSSCILLVAPLLYQQSPQCNKGNNRNIQSICGQQPFCSLKSYQGFILLVASTLEEQNV